jgi:hypothetical protein
MDEFLSTMFAVGFATGGAVIMCSDILELCEELEND